MGRKKQPPEWKAHRYTDVTVWELLEREGLLDRAHTDPWMGAIAPPRTRRRLAQERATLQATRLAGYTPPRTARHTIPDPWLYLTTARGVHYRLQADLLQQWRWQKGGAVSAGWGWQTASTCGARWLWAIRQALWIRQLRVAGERGDGSAAVEVNQAATGRAPPVPCAALPEPYEQRSLFS